jgi:hypothetical protein
MLVGLEVSISWYVIGGSHCLRLKLECLVSWPCGWEVHSTPTVEVCISMPVCKMHSTFEGFWRWCVIICKIVLLEFVHRQNFNVIKLERFGSWILLPSSGKKVGGGGRGQKAYLLGPLVELACLNVQTNKREDRVTNSVNDVRQLWWFDLCRM